jgi:amidase
VHRDLAEIFTPLDGMWEIVSRSEGRTAFLDLSRLHPHLLHEEFMRRANNIGGFTRAELVRAYDTAAQSRVRFDRIAGDFDAVLTLSAPGEAPEGACKVTTR